jgi:hypothetical protein
MHIWNAGMSMGNFASATFGINWSEKTSLVACLCCLHNYCIDCRMKSGSPSDEMEEAVAPLLAIDEAEIASNGGIPMDRTNDNENSPEQLLHGGEHFEDVPAHHHQNYVRLQGSRIMPRDIMLGMIVEKGLRRPPPVQWDPKSY